METTEKPIGSEALHPSLCGAIPERDPQKGEAPS